MKKKKTSVQKDKPAEIGIPKKTRRDKSIHWAFSLFAEGVLLVFSVLLALILNEWRANEKREDNVEIAVAAIKSEMIQNIEQLENSYTRHKKVYDTLMFFDKLNQAPQREIYMAGIFTPAELISTGWETAVQAGITDHMVYSKALEISKAYEAIKQYEQLGNTIVHSTYSNILESGPEAALRDNYRNWALVLFDFSNREERLKEKLTDLVEKL